MRRGLVVTFVATMLASCQDSPRASNPVTPSAPNPAAAPAPSPKVTAVTINGLPSLLAPGESMQLTALGRLDNGDTNDVTKSATWRSSNEAACRVSETGLLSGVGAGTASIEARVGSIVDVHEVVCGYVIDVVVHESAPTIQVLVSGARVEVVGGPLHGQTYLTDATGHATLPPVATSGFTLKFKKTGYDDGQSVVTLPRDRSLDIALVPNFVVTNSWSGTLNPALNGGAIPSTMSGWPADYLFSPHRAGDLILDLQVGCVAFGTYTDFGFDLQTASGRSAGSLYAYGAGVGGGTLQYRYTAAVPLAAGETYRLRGGISGYFGSPCPWSLSVKRPG